MGDAKESVNSQSGDTHEENRSRCQRFEAMFSSRGPSCMPCLHFEKTRLQQMKEMSIRDGDTATGMTGCSRLFRGHKDPRGEGSSNVLDVVGPVVT